MPASAVPGDKPPAHTEFCPDEIVVATTHADRVVKVLGEGEAQQIETHDGLGLTRVVLRDVDALAARFLPVVGDKPTMPGSATPLRVTNPLEVVLAGLRLTFARAWDGWTPRMGKNRVMVGGEGYPITIIRGDGPPAGDVPASDLPRPKSGGDGVTVGLLDTPVRPDLTLDGRLLQQSSRLDATQTASVVQGHGTFTSGLVHQQAGDADVLVRGVLGGRDANATAWEVALALFDLVQTDLSVSIVNMSLGCFTEDNRPPLVLDAAVQMVRDDVVLIAAAGNHGRNAPDGEPTNIAPLWPAALDGVVAVGGRIPHGGGFEPAPFTPRTPWVNLLTDGTDVVSTFLDGKVSVGGDIQQFDGVARWSGSSMASAVAAGRLAALADGEGGARGALNRILGGAPDDVLSVHSAPDPA